MTQEVVQKEPYCKQWRRNALPQHHVRGWKDNARDAANGDAVRTRERLREIERGCLELTAVQGARGQLNVLIRTLDEERGFNEGLERSQAAGADPLTRIPTEARLTKSNPGRVHTHTLTHSVHS